MNNSETFRQRMGRQALEVANMVRRVVVSASKGGAWSVGGYAIPDLRGGSTITTEGEDDDPAEVFGGIGIWARPAGGDRAEGLLLNVGGKAEHGVICAVRNEDARRRYVDEFGGIEPGEVAIFPSSGKSRVILKIDGSIEIQPDTELRVRSKEGVAVKLATMDELNSVVSMINGHGHLYASPGGPAFTTSPTSLVPPSTPATPEPDIAPAAVGTKVLKAE